MRVLERHLRGFVAPVAVVLGVGLLFSAAVGLLFASFGQFVMVGATQAADEAILRWVEARRTPLLDEIALEITSLGALAPVLLVILASAAFLWLTGHRYSTVLLLLALAGGAVLNTLLKDFYERPRPLLVDPLAETALTSFPSGHAMTAFIAYAAIAYLVERLEATRALRAVTIGLAALLIALVGASRVYLGVHYPSDVLGGFLAGMAWLAFVIVAMRTIQFFAERRRPAAIVEERGLFTEREGGRGPSR